jgi:hypothetical protein
LSGKRNLGDYTVKTKTFTGAGLLEFMQEKPVFADAVASVVAGQSHIMFGSKLGQRMASKGLPEKEEDEKDEAWRERVYDQAKANAKARIPGAEFDYCAELRRWAEEDFATRGQKADKREVLSDYYKITGNIEKGWELGAMEKREGLVKKLGLDDEMVAATTAEVLAAIAAKYKPEKVEVKEDDLF